MYNYCDRWCERCPFAPRCRVNLDIARMEAARSATLDDAHAFLNQPFEREPDIPPEQEAAWHDFMADLDEAQQATTPEEDARFAAAWERHRRRTQQHPIAVAAADYMEVALHVLPPIARLVDARYGRDATARLAVETLRHHAWLIHPKAVRACGGLVPDDTDGEYAFAGGNGPADLQSDANGTAKLLRLVIAESIAAWRALGWPGKGLADGVPRALIDRLARLDTLVAEAFPLAMDFVRPGFDDA